MPCAIAGDGKAKLAPVANNPATVRTSRRLMAAPFVERGDFDTRQLGCSRPPRQSVTRIPIAHHDVACDCCVAGFQSGLCRLGVDFVEKAPNCSAPICLL